VWVWEDDWRGPVRIICLGVRRRDGKSQSSVVDRRRGDPDAMLESPRGVNTAGTRTAEVTADISSGFNGAKTARRPLLVGETAAMSTMEKRVRSWEQLEIAFCSLLIGRESHRQKLGC
jgi:hypothetical protein